ncbi:MAG: carbon storage regulator [Aestuariivirga sp.]
MLKIDLRVGESVKIGDTVITLEDKSGRIARLAIKAPQSVPITRVQQATMASVAKGGLALQPA